MHRHIDLSTKTKQLHYHSRLTVDARVDLQWWHDFLPQQSGKSLILNSHGLKTQQCTYLQMSRVVTDRVLIGLDITWKELYAIVVAVHTRGPYWQREKIAFHCDNKVVVDIGRKVILRHLYPWLWYEYFIAYICATHHNLTVCIVNLPVVCNDIADSLSHFQMDRFRKIAAQANVPPDNIPAWATQNFITASCNATMMV